MLGILFILLKPTFNPSSWCDQCPSDHDANAATVSFPRGVGQNMWKAWGAQFQEKWDFGKPVQDWFDEVRKKL